MLATRLLSIGDIRTIDVPTSEPAYGDIVVKVEAAGICGTDRHLFKGEFPSVDNTTLGHEFSGIVVDSGDSEIAVGDRVTCVTLITGAVPVINARKDALTCALTIQQPVSGAMGVLQSIVFSLLTEPMFCLQILIRCLVLFVNLWLVHYTVWIWELQNLVSVF